ncbi:hypothetical protein JCM15764A_18120 [Geotalea toluenoxydans]
MSTIDMGVSFTRPGQRSIGHPTVADYNYNDLIVSQVLLDARDPPLSPLFHRGEANPVSRGVDLPIP